MELTAVRFSEWLDRYFRAWRSNDPGEVASLFAENAVYFYGPFKEPARGREAIVARWVAGSADQADVACDHEVLATHRDLGVAHWHVRFRTQSGVTELDGVLTVRFNSSLECVEHREWYSRRDEHT